ATSSAASTVCGRRSTMAVMPITVPCVAGGRPAPPLRTTCEEPGATLGVMWNPDVYLPFADHRARPFFDLTSRVAAENPRRVVGLGCGPGNIHATLATCWPDHALEA